MYSGMRAIFAICFITITFSACSYDYNKNPYTPEVKAFYESPHGLRKMFNKREKIVTKTPSEGSMSGGFFLFIGGIGGSYKEGTTIEHNITYVQFAWDIANSTYAITNVPLDKVRVRIVDKIEVPTVAFFLDEIALSNRFASLTSSTYDPYADQMKSVEKNSELHLLRNNYDAPEFLNENMKYLKYIVINCSGSDWSQNITLPLNQ